MPMPRPDGPEAQSDHQVVDAAASSRHDESGHEQTGKTGLIVLRGQHVGQIIFFVKGAKADAVIDHGLTTQRTTTSSLAAPVATSSITAPPLLASRTSERIAFSRRKRTNSRTCESPCPPNLAKSSARSTDKVPGHINVGIECAPTWQAGQRRCRRRPTRSDNSMGRARRGRRS